MTGPDLRTLFRSNLPELTATAVFADREDEWSAVAQSLAALVGKVRAPQFNVEDLEAPRRNVLAFYGMGGIGKTTLSRRITDHLRGGVASGGWPALDATLGKVLPVRIDLSSQAGLGFESIIVALRVAVASLGRSMPAFDLAFHRYWTQAHPGEPLAQYLRRSTFLSRFPDSQMSEQMQQALADTAQALAMPGTIGTLVGTTLSTVVMALRERRSRGHALAGCRRLPDLLEAEPDLDALSYYTHLLAWDLSRLPAGKTVTPVVLLDTFEDVSDRMHRDVERLIQRMVWLMPNALFVITGRNRLQWEEEELAGQLDWVGSRCWPGLASGATGEPRQHRVGYLSRSDSEQYLERRLTVGKQPVMSRAIRQVIVDRSHGLPLFLDLAVMRYLDLRGRHGAEPPVDELDQAFPSLVASVVRDLTGEERQVLRTVSLLESFSVPLAVAATGVRFDAPVVRLVERPFVDYEPNDVWPYHLHSLVRAAVRDTDAGLADRWSDDDWARAAARVLEALGLEFTQAGERHDRRRVIGCLRQGLWLAYEFGLPLGWLVDAAFEYVADWIWEPLDFPQHRVAGDAAVTARSEVAAALAGVLGAVARRQREHRQASAETLRAVLASGVLPTAVWELPQYFLAEIDRDLGHLAASADGMRQVVDGGGRLAEDAARGLAHVARRLGRFTDVQAAAEALGPRGRRHRTLGDLWWTQARIGLACASYAQAREVAAQAGEPGEAALSQACLAFAAAFGDRLRAAEQIRQAERMLSGVAARWATLQTRNAGLLCDAGADPELPVRVTAAVVEAQASGLSSIVAYARFALCLHAAVLDDADLLDHARNELARSVDGAEFAYLVEITAMMGGTPPPEGLPLADWVDGPAETGARWCRLVEERRAELRLSGE